MKIGKNFETMEVHAGKAHTDNLECGLCENNFENIENLNLHLQTCDIFICRRCFRKENNISDIKSHVEKKHNDLRSGATIIDHLKISRIDEDEVTSKEHWNTTGFPSRPGQTMKLSNKLYSTKLDIVYNNGDIAAMLSCWNRIREINRENLISMDFFYTDNFYSVFFYFYIDRLENILGGEGGYRDWFFIRLLTRDLPSGLFSMLR